MDNKSTLFLGVFAGSFLALAGGMAMGGGEDGGGNVGRFLPEDERGLVGQDDFADLLCRTYGARHFFLTQGFRAPARA